MTAAVAAALFGGGVADSTSSFHEAAGSAGGGCGGTGLDDGLIGDFNEPNIVPNTEQTHLMTNDRCQFDDTISHHQSLNASLLNIHNHHHHNLYHHHNHHQNVNCPQQSVLDFTPLLDIRK